MIDSYFSRSITHRYFFLWESQSGEKKELHFSLQNFTKKIILYNKSTYSCILIGSHQEPMNYDLLEERRLHDVIIKKHLKWWKCFRILVIFYVNGRKIRYTEVLSRL